MKRYSLTLAALALTALSSAQKWDAPYENGLNEVKAGQWGNARTDFLEAAALRKADSSSSTNLPGPIFERRRWRGGAPYSANFLAAYCGLRQAIQMQSGDRDHLLNTVASEFEGLLDKRQYSREAFFFLDECYVLTSNLDKRLALGKRYADVGSKADWKVDLDGIAPEDEALVAEMPTPPTPTPEPKPARRPRTTKPAHEMAALPASAAPAPTPAKSSRRPAKRDKRGHAQKLAAQQAVLATPPPPAQTAAAPVTGPQESQSTNQVVRPVAPKQNLPIPAAANSPVAPFVGGVIPSLTKYALIIGNSESKIEGGSVPFASDDAQIVRQTLVSSAGYPDQNVELVINATAAQMAASINALASRIPDKATVLIYYTGVGENIDGKDYLAGVDSDMDSDSSSMISKDDVYKAFSDRGARIFAFFQANRPIQNGRFFGSEIPMVGTISQMQATIPGSAIGSTTRDGKQVGLFTDAVVSVLNGARSSQTPILDFGWQVFYRVRTGGTGDHGGASNQPPSLPVLTNMASDAKF